MIIKDMRNKAKEVEFKNIKAGECFIDCAGDLSMRIVDIESFDVESLNAIVLSTGQLWACYENTPVIPVNTHIVIESEE